MSKNSIITNIPEEMTDQLEVGNWIIKIGSPQGATANIATKEEKSTWQSRSTPLILDQPSDSILNRQQSVKEAIAAFQSGESVEFYGTVGVGKTVLLRNLAQNNQVKSLFPSGVISLSPVHPNVDDLLQSIWDAFYESNIPYKPTYNQIRQQLQEKQALVVLDDDGLIQDELEELMNAAHQCTFLIASSTQRMKKRGRSMLLSGLSINDTLALVERELERSLNTEELAGAKSLCTIFNGHPMKVQIAVANILEEGRSLTEVVSLLSTDAPGNYLLQQIVASLSTSQRIILSLLTVMGGVGLESEQIIHITEISDAFNILEGLRRRNLVQFDGSRYQVSKTVVELLPPEWKLTAPVEKAIAYFINWAERHQQQPNILLSQTDAIIQIIEIAVRESRWKDVLRLVKAVEETLALSKQWGLWGQVLSRGLQASQAETDKVAQVWALHQLGTRALCLEENSTAKDYLTKAIQLRESLDDAMGVAATRHNLNLLENSPSWSSTQNSQRRNVNDSAKNFTQSPLPTTNDTNHLLTRMNIVSSQNTSPSGKSVYKKALLFPTGIITTGIVASGGLLAWFNWHRFTPLPSPTSTTAPTTTKRSPIPKPKPTAPARPSLIIEPPSTLTVPLSPLPEVIPKVNPPLTPNIQDQQPILPKREKLKRKPTPAPATPTTTVAPTLIQPTPETTVVPTTEETTPTPTFTPSAAPNSEQNQPTVEPTPTPITPIPTPVPTPTSETTPTSSLRNTPTAQPSNVTIDNNPVPTPTDETTPTTQSSNVTIDNNPVPTPTGETTAVAQPSNLTIDNNPVPTPTGETTAVAQPSNLTINNNTLPTPTSETTPASAFTLTPMAESPNSTIDHNTVVISITETTPTSAFTLTPVIQLSNETIDNNTEPRTQNTE
ncbi:AAA ATPase [Kalymmatonema gypsitolerans NIES-4073]|nr:AAA ATPase [Scytonema sp. NIES-4073]